MTMARVVQESELKEPKRTLSTIVGEMLDALDESGGEVSEQLDMICAELEEKASAYAAVVRQLQAEQEAFEHLVASYKQKAEQRANTITGLKFRMAAALEAVGVDKLKTATCTWYWQSSKRVDIPDEAAFCEGAEDRFIVQKVYPDKGAIKKALEAGEQIEGAQLAESKHLRFR